jgi:hypothetical protein
MQMMKKERKEGYFMNETAQENSKMFQDRLKEKPKRIINILLNGSNVDLVNPHTSKSHRSNQANQNSYEVEKFMSSSKNLLVRA